MKRKMLAALAAPSMLMALAFSTSASAQLPTPYWQAPRTAGQNAAPTYNGGAEDQAAFAQQTERRYYRDWRYDNRNDRRADRRADRRSWQARGLEAAPPGYRWVPYSNGRHALVRRSNGAIVDVR